MSDETPMSYPNGRGGRKVNDLPQPDTWHRVASVPAPYPMPITFDTEFPREWAYMLEDLFALWAAKLTRNRLRMRYYSGKNVLHDFGISIPPQLLNVETVVGWPQKAVDTMAVRSRFDGFSATDPETQAMLDGITASSRLRVKYRQAVQGTLIHSCSFATVEVGEDGEPRIDFHSAECAAARWDDAKGRIAYGMTIEGWREGMPAAVNLYTEDCRVSLWNDGRSFWEWAAQPYVMGRPTMEALVYRPTQSKPFGQSRITRAVMSITDSAVRESLRTEISAEFFTSPQKYLLGADRDAFEHRTKWEAYIGNIFAATRDENGDIPAYGQLPQMTMEPLLARRRELAKQFSGQTGVPTHSLGISSDSNPTSFEAMHMAENDIVIEAERLNRSNAQALENVAKMALAISDGVPLPALDVKVTAKFANPQRPSASQRVDFAMKTAAIYPQYVTSPVFKEDMGWDAATRVRLEEHEKAAGARQMVTQLAQGR